MIFLSSQCVGEQLCPGFVGLMAKNQPPGVCGLLENANLLFYMALVLISSCSRYTNPSKLQARKQTGITLLTKMVPIYSQGPFNLMANYQTESMGKITAGLFCKYRAIGSRAVAPYRTLRL